jgi:hypothetical protein
MGPLVEQFPLHLPTRKDAVQHNKFLIKQMKNCAYNNDKNNKDKKRYCKASSSNQSKQ